eukprot:TRINITY_DN1467_c0_g1_i1.p1 TRINITY_DN1467_c0_g1~~TRINITY_DN1467_c0_g1_i1.p1  ORF type:complete len:360 (+),score=110.90 TRINITY_DN1467_c0_g1_i1:3-1082(+)
MYKYLLILAFLLAYSEQRNYVISSSEKIGIGQLIGPESLVFGSDGLLYTGCGDGTIRTVNVTSKQVALYARSEPNLTPEQLQTCISASSLSPVVVEPLCGRPLGLVFDSHDNLYVADAYKGLKKIPRSDPTQVQVLSTEANGVPYKFVNSVILTKDERYIYFTDSSTVDRRFNFVKVFLTAVPNGRLLKYDLHTNQVTVLLSDLQFGNGVALAKDESYLLVQETSLKRIRKLHLKGPRTGRVDILIEDIGCYNDNIKIDEDGYFWVGCFSESSDRITFIQQDPQLVNIFNTYVPPTTTLTLAKTMGIFKKIDGRSGRIIDTYVDETATKSAYVAEAEPKGDSIYLGSVILPYITKVPRF